MNRKIRLGAVLTIFFVAKSIQGCSCGCMSKQIDDEFKHMEKIARSIGDWTYSVQKNIRDMFSHDPALRKAQQKLTFSEDKKHVFIKLALGEGITTFDGNIEPHQLTIEIPEINQTILVNYDKKSRFLSVGSKQKKEAKHSASYGMMRQGQTIQTPLNLKKATFRYEDGELIISIAKKMAEKKAPKKITVEMK